MHSGDYFNGRGLPARGLLQWKVMSVGLHSAPATFQRTLDIIILINMDPNAFAYLDDIIVVSRTFEEHMKYVRQVFRRLPAANMNINPAKFLGTAS